MNRTAYLQRAFSVPEALADDLAGYLVATGALGCEVKDEASEGRCVVEVWFAAEEPPVEIDVSLWPGVTSLGDEEVEEKDWLADYRAASQPFTIGRVRIDPRDCSELISEPGRIDLHVPAENAFGTGSHESTRLMLRWLQEMELAGSQVLDVGSGSGILSFAALRLGASSAIGFDFDLPSAITARLNGQRNGVAPLFFAGTAAALQGEPCFDLLLINVLPERVLGDLARLVNLLVPGGRLVSSGNLVCRRDELVPIFEGYGLGLLGEKVDGEWTSFLFERVSP